MTQTLTQLQALEAFCSVQPTVEEVTALLAQHGFEMVLAMGPTTFAASKQYPAPPQLPAHYHYRDRYGTEVIYLAGRDFPEHQHEYFPPHASRWWIYPGASQLAYNGIHQVLTNRWLPTWQPTDT